MEEINNICPICHSTLRYYIHYNYGVVISGLHCDKCHYDTNDGVVTYTTSTEKERKVEKS